MIATTTYKLGSTAYKIWYAHELPKSYELESYESINDMWIRINSDYYNVNEFCTVGMPSVPMPHGGAQLASNGYFMIASHDGEIFPVSSTTLSSVN